MAICIDIVCRLIFLEVCTDSEVFILIVAVCEKLSTFS